MRTKLKIVFGIIAAACVMMFSSCSKSYTNADIAGTWTNHVMETDQEWIFNADGTYTEKSVTGSDTISYGTEDSGKFHFEGDMIFFESVDEWGNNGSFKVNIVDSNTMTWETEAGKIREFKRK